MNSYKSSERYHEVTWMFLHSKDLETKTRRMNDSSKVIYCCLELRNILEMIEFHLLLASVTEEEHTSIANIAKSHRGNDKANKLLKSISFKSQKFYECVCENINQDAVFFDFKRSNEYKTELSEYLHTNTKTPKEMEFDKSFIQSAFKLINETRNFIEKSLIKDGDSFIVKNLNFKTLSKEDEQVFQDWKNDKISEEEMSSRIKANIATRRNS